MRNRGGSAEPSGQAHSRRKGSWCRGPEPEDVRSAWLEQRDAGETGNARGQGEANHVGPCR